MTVENQPQQPRRLLITALLVGVGIAVAALVYNWATLSNPSGTPEPIAGAATGTGPVTLSQKAVAGSSGDSVSPPDTAIAEERKSGDNRVEASSPRRTAQEPIATSERAQPPMVGVANGAMDEAQNRTDKTVMGATRSAGPETSGDSEVAIADPEITSAETEAASDTGREEEAEEDRPSEENAPLEGYWDGRIEASVARSGKWTCAGGRIVANLFYLEKGDIYMFSGTIIPDEGYLQNVPGRYFLFNGDVQAEGTAKAHSQELPRSWGISGYRATYSGSYSHTQGNGTWVDNFGCSGTWSVTKGQTSGSDEDLG